MKKEATNNENIEDNDYIKIEKDIKALYNVII